MIESGLVLPARLRELFAEVEPQLIRYPAIDAPTLRARVMAVAGGKVGSYSRHMNAPLRFAGFPGAGLIERGLVDLAEQKETVAILLVQIGSPRLGRCAVAVPVLPDDALDADRKLYRLLAAKHGNEAHSRYNALIRQLISFERALERSLSRGKR